MVKAAWFRSYAANERPDQFDRMVQSWDTANKASELNHLGDQGQRSSIFWTYCASAWNIPS
jgi:phage terminase large subunit-like protein